VFVNVVNCDFVHVVSEFLISTVRVSTIVYLVARLSLYESITRVGIPKAVR
jgi:hypothetical protein